MAIRASGLSGALGLAIAVLGGFSLQLVRRANARAIQHRSAALAAGDSGAIRQLQYGALVRDAARGAGLTILGLACAWLLARYAWLDRSTALGLTLVAVGCGLSAVIGGALRSAGRGSAAPLARGGGDRRTHRGGAPMNGGWHAWLRLFAVQGTWNYERLLGVGMGYAAEPLLEDLKTVDPVRHTEAVVRSAEFFNCNPNLAGLALGATARAEYDGVPGCADRPAPHRALQPARRAGRPALLGRADPAAARRRDDRDRAGRDLVGGARLPGALQPRPRGDRDLGAAGGSGSRAWASAPRSGNPGSPRRSSGSGPAAGFSIGAAVPLVGAWYLDAIGWPAAFGAVAVAATGVAVTRWFGASLTTVRFTLLALILLVLFRWVLP